MPSPRLQILPWSQPLVRAATAWLAGDWKGGGPLDLADTLVVVPTSQAGRRLRESLAGYAAQRVQAVFPPRIALPDALSTLDAAVAGAASRTELLLAWIETLLASDLDGLREVFPVDPPERNFAWASRLARDFARLQNTLSENGLRMADVVARAGDDFPEAARWAQLGQLEKRYDDVLAERGLCDPLAIKIQYADQPALPAGIRRIVVAGTPDPLPIALKVLAAHAEAGVSVYVLVSGPDDPAGRSLFDPWGRPVPEVWSARAFSPADFEERTRLCADPAAQAAVITDCAARYPAPGGLLGVGMADPEVAPALESGLVRAGVPVFNPEGRPRRGEALHTLLTALASLVMRDPLFADVAALLRCPDVLEWLGGASSALLRELDDLHADHLPPTLSAARAHARKPSASRALDRVALLRGVIQNGTFSEGARAALTEIFKDRRFDQARDEDGRMIEAAQAWAQVLAELDQAEQRFPGLSREDAWQMALDALGDTRRFGDKPEGAVELQGWLELLWDDVPHLVVAGMNDGRVPDAVAGDAYLPEALRERLGLKTNAARFARDAYLLHTLEAFRADGRGRLDLLVGKTSTAGDPLRPSRLLLQCADPDLPARVAYLFRPAGAARPNPAWRRAWKLKPRTDAKIETLSVTSFRDYLKCPFRFYLKRGLRMEAVDPAKTEMDAMDFGTLCHAALEAMGKPDSPMRDCTDAAVLREFLLRKLESEAVDRYGASPALPIVVQLESARQRLSKAAEVQAQARAEGWVILETERAFEIVIEGMKVRGKIDRIDRNELTGGTRVIDYKTSDKPVDPSDAHMRGMKKGETADMLPDFARFTVGDDDMVWTDLQLPLYLEAVGAEFGRAAVCGYFNLPKAAGETGVSVWNGYDSLVQESAMRCARGVIAAVKQRSFWPPRELSERDEDFPSLFLQGAEASVDWEPSKEGTGS